MMKPSCPTATCTTEASGRTGQWRAVQEAAVTADLCGASHHAMSIQAATGLVLGTVTSWQTQLLSSAAAANVLSVDCGVLTATHTGGADQPSHLGMPSPYDSFGHILSLMKAGPS